MDWGSVPDWLGVAINGAIAWVAIQFPIQERRERRLAEAELRSEREATMVIALSKARSMIRQLVAEARRWPRGGTFQPPSLYWAPLLQDQAAHLTAIMGKPGVTALQSQAVQAAKALLTGSIVGMDQIVPAGSLEREDFLEALAEGLRGLERSLAAAGIVLAED